MNGPSLLRKLTADEDDLLRHLLRDEFPGRDQLLIQIECCLARVIDQEGSLEFKTSSTAYADVLRRIPVEGEAEDSDGVLVHYLLHVVNGAITELEIYKDDGSPILRKHRVDEIRLIHLE